MKKILQTVFFWNESAAGAVFGCLLSVLFSFCFCNFLLPQIFIPLALQCAETVESISILGLCVLAPLPIVLYYSFLILRFFFRQDQMRFKPVFWAILALNFFAFFICLGLGLADKGLLICSVLFLGGFNALCIKKQNFQWYILQLICAVGCLSACSIILQGIFESFISNPGALSIPRDWRVPAAYSGVLFFAGMLFCNFKLWASANNKRLCEVWGTGCYALVGLLAISYTLIIMASLYQQKRCEMAVEALEENFQRKMTAAALEESYYQGRETDENFHQELTRAWQNFSNDTQETLRVENSVFHTIFSEFNTLDQLPGEYRERFFSSDAEALGKFFDAPLPAKERAYTPGKLSIMPKPELQYLRPMAYFFAWQIRISCENKDPVRMMLAWERSAFITEYLRHDTLLISQLVLLAVEEIRLNSLEWMLSSNLLSDNTLSAIQQDLKIAAGKIPEIDRDTLYTEAVTCIDALRDMPSRTLYVTLNSETTGAEEIKHYSFLMPGLWYIGNSNLLSLLQCYNAESLSKLNEDMVPSLNNVLPSMLIGPFKKTSEKLYSLEMRYQAFVTLIEAKKIKRQTGQYPETIPLNIIDIFSGEPLRYKVGTHEKEESFLKQKEQNNTEEMYFAERTGNDIPLGYRQKTVQGVAVWSIGRNKQDEYNYNNDVRNPPNVNALLPYGKFPIRKPIDDQRALITIHPE